MRDVCPDTSAIKIIGVAVATQYGPKYANMGDYLVKKKSGDFFTIDARSFDNKYTRKPIQAN